MTAGTASGSCCSTERSGAPTRDLPAPSMLSLLVCFTSVTSHTAWATPAASSPHHYCPSRLPGPCRLLGRVRDLASLSKTSPGPPAAQACAVLKSFPAPTCNQLLKRQACSVCQGCKERGAPHLWPDSSSLRGLGTGFGLWTLKSYKLYSWRQHLIKAAIKHEVVTKSCRRCVRDQVKFLQGTAVQATRRRGRARLRPADPWPAQRCAAALSLQRGLEGFFEVVT